MAGIAWFGALLIACYLPVLSRLVHQWNDDPDMGHGFFVPVIAGFIVWQRREESDGDQACSRTGGGCWWWHGAGCNC